MVDVKIVKAYPHSLRGELVLVHDHAADGASAITH
jgi:tRNA-2-methylthio-N6-dimethylallyladenosine synthase